MGLGAVNAQRISHAQIAMSSFACNAWLGSCSKVFHGTDMLHRIFARHTDSRLLRMPQYKVTGAGMGVGPQTRFACMPPSQCCGLALVLCCELLLRRQILFRKWKNCWCSWGTMPWSLQSLQFLDSSWWMKMLNLSDRHRLGAAPRQASSARKGATKIATWTWFRISSMRHENLTQP